jgi:hypothetical protein
MSNRNKEDILKTSSFKGKKISGNGKYVDNVKDFLTHFLISLKANGIFNW